jgi:flagellar assembly protein FliH
MSSKLLRAADAAGSAVAAWRIPAVAGARPAVQTAAATPEVRNADQEQQIEARAQASYQQGFAAGEAAAAQRAVQKLEPVLAGLSAVIEELSAARKRVRAEAEQDTVKLALAIARRVLHRELSTDPEAILGIVLAAFQKLNARETHRLRVSTAEAAVVRENRARLALPPGLDIAADAALPPGSAIFETSRGDLDASVDTQLAEIEHGFADVVARRSR